MIILILYVPLTLWLVLITREMSLIALNAQKASNRPELKCTLLISNEKPAAKNLEILNSEDAKYIENKEGANVFFLVQNLHGSGKAINLSIALEFEASIPDKISLKRNFDKSFLSPGDSIASYIYRFEWSGLPDLSLKLVKCKISYTTPFDEASKEPLKEINFDRNEKLPAEGNKVDTINLGDGIRKIIMSEVENKN